MTEYLNAPASQNTVRVRLINTTTKFVVKAEYFAHPVLPGHEEFNLTDASFLIENERLGKKAVYDLGCRRDFWNYPPETRARMTKILTGLKVEKNSHPHFDHIGDPTTFPKSTDLIVGPDFVQSFLPAYPTNAESKLDNAVFEGRILHEIDFQRSTVIGGFRAFDFFGDGSFYLLDTPGHCISHICGLARTTPETFILMGGDICHFPGYFRPNKMVPLSDEVLKSAGLVDPFTSHAGQACHISTEERQTPIYTISKSPHSAYVDRGQALKDISKLVHLDTNPSVLVCLAHDPGLFQVLPTLNDDPREDLNGWKAKGWKEKCRWKFLDELPREGRRNKKLLVTEIWVEGRKVETLV